MLHSARPGLNSDLARYTGGVGSETIVSPLQWGTNSPAWQGAGGGLSSGSPRCVYSPSITSPVLPSQPVSTSVLARPLYFLPQPHDSPLGHATGSNLQGVTSSYRMLTQGSPADQKGCPEQVHLREETFRLQTSGNSSSHLASKSCDFLLGAPPASATPLLSTAPRNPSLPRLITKNLLVASPCLSSDVRAFVP